MNLTFFPVEDVPTPWSVPERVASERNPSSRTAFGRTAPDKPGTCAKSQRVMPLANQAVRIVRRTQRKQIGSLDGIGVSWRYRHAMWAC